MGTQLESQSLLKTLGELRADINVAKVCSDNTVNIMLWCRGGRRRSVAHAKILSYVLRSEGFQVNANRHLSEGSWGNLCHSSDCKQCGSRAAVKRSHVRADALSLWASM